MYIVVDVETGHTVPTNGALLSIGAVAISESGSKLDTFYCNLAYDDKTFDQDTMEFWEKQDQKVQEAAFDWTKNRLHPASAMSSFVKWVMEVSPEKSDTFFTSNPGSFDSAWIFYYLDRFGIKNPFSHRVLCIRSFAFGKFGGTFGQKREDEDYFVKSEVPHHALYDAQSEAETLANLLK